MIIVFDFFFRLSNSLFFHCSIQHRTSLNFLQEFVLPFLMRTVCQLSDPSKFSRPIHDDNNIWFPDLLFEFKIFFLLNKMTIETTV